MRRILLLIPVLCIFAGVLFGGHWYIAQRLIVESGLPAAWQTALLFTVALCAFTLILQPFGERLLRPPLSRLIAWPASLWMGLFFYLFWGVVASDLALAGATLVSPKLAAAATTDGLSTAHSLGGFRAAGVFVLALLFVAAGLRGGLAPPALKRVELALARWPAALDGFRIVQISDIHIGPIRGRDFARHLTDRVNALDADLVAITGDLVDGSASRLRDEVSPFGDLEARHGVYFVTGNHDHYSGADPWSDRLRELGIRVLRNERLTIPAKPEERDDPGACFDLAGVDDHRSGFETGRGGEDLGAALADLPPDRAVVLLAHDPSTFKKASKMGIDLQLSGHTHGGQIWPFGVLVRIAVPFVAGLYRRGDAQVYVSRGTGFWGPPMRLGSPAEITEIVLRRDATRRDR